nr:MAG TPA: hypothetical protein [Bacteriophage sp.]DAX86548.1 MAG TPA: hypothetical protein [Caudoviricetes sp.]
MIFKILLAYIISFTNKKAYQPRFYSKLIGYLLCYSVINNCFTTQL